MKRLFNLKNVFSFLVFSFLVFSFNNVFAASSSITTKDASSIKLNSATLNANVDSVFNSTAGSEYWFEYGTNSNNFPFVTALTKTTSIGNISKEITGLSSNYTYYFRSCIRDSSSVFCSNVKSFNTYRNPSVSNGVATNIADTTAKISGNINDLGGTTSVSYWFEYGIGSSYSGKLSTTIKTTQNIGNIDFDLTKLKSDTQYYYKLCIKTDFSTTNFCSSDVSFTTNKTIVLPTDSRAPIIKNVSYEFTSQNSVKLKARLDNLGTFSSLNYFFEYGNNLEYGYSINDSKNLTVASDYFLELKNLNFDVTYYFRACVRDIINPDNKYCSEPSFFTVIDYKNAPLQIEENYVTDVKDKTAKISAVVSGFGGNEQISVYANIVDSNGKIFQTSQTKIPYTVRNFSILVEGLESNKSYGYSLCLYTSSKISCDVATGSFMTIRNITLGSVYSTIDTDSVNLVGNIDDIGTRDYSNVKTWFTYTADVNFKNGVISTIKNPFSNSNVVETISGLKKNQKYYYKFCANNGLEDICSSVYDFIIIQTDPKNEPKKTITDPNVILYNFIKTSSTSVKILVKVMDFGGASSVNSYVSYGEKSDSLKNTSQVLTKEVGDIVDFSINNLVAGKKYYYKVCSKNTSKTYCSGVFEFSLFENNNFYGSFSKIPNEFKNNKLDVKYAETLRGKILYQNEFDDNLWYIDPINLKRYYLDNYVNAFNVFKTIAQQLSDEEFNSFKNKKATAKYAGKIILKASEPEVIYYVDTKTYRMWYFVNKDEVEFIVRNNYESISNSGLLKLDYYELEDVIYKDINDKDIDGDGIFDDIEINIFKTNPYYLDTDDDGYPDKTEITRGYSPVIKGK